MDSLPISSAFAPGFLTYPCTFRRGALSCPLLPCSAHIRPRAAMYSNPRAAMHSNSKPFATSVPDSVLRLESSFTTPAFASGSQSPAMAMRGAESDVMGLLLRERIVFLGYKIDDFVADAINSQLLILDAQDPTKDIRLFINSAEGSLSATLAIYDVIQLLRADVSTIALGIASSTSSIILGGGTKGKRLAMPNARIMIQQPVGGASGKATAVEVQAREIMNNKDCVIRIISGITGRTIEQVEKDIDRDRYMSPMEAVEYGIIDGVIDADAILPLESLPEKVKPKFNYEGINKDSSKFLIPEIPDDEIY